MSWIEKRAQFDSRNSTLSQEDIQGRISQLKQSINNYVQNTGNTRNINFEKIQKLMTELNDIKGKYNKLNMDIINYLKNESKAPELSTLLMENGDLQQKIQRLEKMDNEIKIDVESAIARDELLRSKNKEINSHTLYLLDRPVRRGSIPYLWVLSVLFIGMGILLFYYVAPPLIIYNQYISFSSFFIELFTNTQIIGSLLIASLIVIIFLSLKIAGVFGK
jgi:hypothetical protein